MIQFYLPDISDNPRLPEEESHHCTHVLRKREGDEIVAVDGKGGRYRCRLVAVGRRQVELEVMEREEVADHWLPRIELAVAPTKNADRMEWMVEKVTELGINRITPLRCAHSERKSVNVGRLRKIAVSAMKQSLKASLPEVDDVAKFEDYVSEPFDGDKFICYCDADTPRTQIILQPCGGRVVRIVIGPEGDFAPQEIAKAFAAGYKAVSLGNSRLRTETAAMIAVADVHVVRRMYQCGMQPPGFSQKGDATADGAF